ncbi:MAG: hypothetical protein AAFY88_02440 [Acidobacteriota bacterium]
MFSLFPDDVPFAHGHREQGIESKLIVIVEVLVSESQAENSLAQQLLHTVFDPARLSRIDKTVRKAPYDVQFLVKLLKGHDTPVGGEIATAEVGRQNPAFRSLQLDAIGLTVCIQGLRLIVFLSDSWYSTYSTMAALFSFTGGLSGLDRPAAVHRVELYGPRTDDDVVNWFTLQRRWRRRSLREFCWFC